MNRDLMDSHCLDSYVVSLQCEFSDATEGVYFD